MPVKTEGPHAAEFILSEANGQRSRHGGTVASGQNLKAGEVVQDNGAGKLTAFTAVTNSAGDLVTEALGVLIYPIDASAADAPGAYIARDAEVNLERMTFPPETSTGGEKANTIASLAKLGIVARTVTG